MKSRLEARIHLARAWVAALMLGAGCQSVAPDPRLETLDLRVTKLEQRPAAGDQTAPPLGSGSPPPDAAPAAASGAAMEALTARLAEVEKRLGALATAAPPAQGPPDGLAGRLAQIEAKLAAIDAALAKPKPYAGESEDQIRSELLMAKLLQSQIEAIERKTHLAPDDPMRVRMEEFIVLLREHLAALPTAPTEAELKLRLAARLMRQIVDLEIDLMQFDMNTGGSEAHTKMVRDRQAIYREALR